MKGFFNDHQDEEFQNIYKLYEEALSDDNFSDDDSTIDFFISQDERYSHKQQVGHGGSKKIIRVYDNQTRRYVAMAQPISGDNDPQYESFIRESWITAQLDHPNIINIHEIGLDQNNIPYFTMDLKTGHNLEDIIQSLRNEESDFAERFPIKTLLGFFIKICDAIAYAHSINILHLDLKPANIEIGEFGEVIVCDWGLAHFLGRRKSQDINRDLLELDLLEEPSCVIKGTPAYMAPEQILGEETTTASDIYGLAAVLYQMVTLETTVNPKDQKKAMENAVIGEIITPRELAGVSDGLSSIIMKGLSIIPDDRYSSVLELRDDLVKYLDGYVTSAEDWGLLKEFLFFCRRHKTSCLITFVFLLSTIITTSVFINHLQQSRGAEREARMQAEENALKHQQALRLYKNERAMGMEVKEEFSGVLLDMSQPFNNSNFINMPEVILLKSLKGAIYKLEQNPDDYSMKERMTITLFLLQRYAEAKQFLSKKNKFNYLQQGIDEALKINHVRNGRNVPLPVFIAALRGLRMFGPATKSTAYRAIAYDLKTRTNLNGYEGVLKEALMLWNDHWLEKTFFYDKKNFSLKVSGDNLNTLEIYDKFSQISLLKTIPVKKLDISNSEIKDLIFLEGSQIQRLDIRHTFIQDLNYLTKLEDLKELIITSQQFPPEKIETLPPHIKVFISN